MVESATFQVYFVRHAQAGHRSPGRHDIYRPLNEEGHRRAIEIADVLEPVGVAACLSSPATRCVQTLDPLSARLGLPVVEQPDLWEDARVEDALALLEATVANLCAAGDHAAVACSHGNIIPEVLSTLGRNGTPVTGRGCEKGSIWLLEHDGARWSAATRRK